MTSFEIFMLAIIPFFGANYFFLWADVDVRSIYTYFSILSIIILILMVNQGVKKQRPLDTNQVTEYIKKQENPKCISETINFWLESKELYEISISNIIEANRNCKRKAMHKQNESSRNKNLEIMKSLI